MKQSCTCPKCQGRRIARIEHVPDDGPEGRHLGLRLGFIRRSVAGVEAYVCVQCGYFEEYVKERELAEVPWEKLDGFSWHVRPGRAPYR